MLQPIIDGKPADPHCGDVLEVLNPATGELAVRLPAGCADDAAAAVAAARAAAAGWARTAPAERSAAIKEAARALRAAAEDVAQLGTREGGKPLADSRGGVAAAIAAMEQYAELGPLHRGRALAGGWGATDLMVREPRGVAAVLTPWNDPVAIPGQNLAAALVAGNTVVFKPSERTPACGHRLAECLVSALPPGVCNVVHGDARVARPLVADPGVDVVLHVGSVATGRAIAAATAATGAKAILELGGNDPLIVDAGVDPEWAAGQAAVGAFANAGQICVAVERIYVHEAVARPFIAALVGRARALRVGAPTDPATEMGPLVDRRHREAVHGHVADALSGGAQLLAGGVIPDGAGAFYPPTVLTEVREQMRVLREETFGPVAPVAVVGSFDEALARAAAGGYGLAATVLTGEMSHAQEAWRSLPVGTVKVNAVFGGAPGGAAEPHRGSGRGFGYGPELLDELTTVKLVHLTPPPG